MEFFYNLDVWDYLTLILLVISLILILGGISKLKKANPQQVDEKKLKTRAWGSLVVATTYLLCHYFS